jgi:hypothetical protein
MPFLLQVLFLVPSILFLAWMVFAILSIAKGAPFVRSKNSVVATMIALSGVTTGVKTVDIGSGNGRIVLAFAREGALAYGYEINWLLVVWSRLMIRRAGLAGRAFVYCKNLWRQNFSDFSIVTVYGIPHIMAELEAKLVKELPVGARILSNTFRFPTLPLAQQEGTVYLYIITSEIKERVSAPVV